jgi:hypothetical protein
MANATLPQLLGADCRRLLEENDEEEAVSEFRFDQDISRVRSRRENRLCAASLQHAYESLRVQFPGTVENPVGSMFFGELIEVSNMYDLSTVGVERLARIFLAGSAQQAYFQIRSEKGSLLAVEILAQMFQPEVRGVCNKSEIREWRLNVRYDVQGQLQALQLLFMTGIAKYASDEVLLLVKSKAMDSIHLSTKRVLDTAESRHRQLRGGVMPLSVFSKELTNALEA